MLLGVPNVLLAGGEAVRLVNDDRVPAFSLIGTGSLFPAITGEVFKVKRDDAFVEFGIEVSLEKLSDIREAVVRHRDSEPRERGEFRLHLRNRRVDRFAPIVAETDLKIDRTLPVAFSAFLRLDSRDVNSRRFGL